MPTEETVHRFIARVEANAHVDAVFEFYAQDCVIRENLSEPRLGRDAQVTRERALFGRAAAVTSRCVPPVLRAGDHVAIRWIFEFRWRDGTSTRMEEIALQRWDNERIAEETFFYDPIQKIPKAMAADAAPLA